MELLLATYNYKDTLSFAPRLESLLLIVVYSLSIKFNYSSLAKVGHAFLVQQ